MTLRVAFRIIAPAAAGAAALVPIAPATVDRVYADGLYPRVQRLATTISNLVPVALLDAAVIVLLIWLGAAVVKAWRRDRRLFNFGMLGLNLIVAVSLAYLWFLAAWGLNYRRTPIQSHLDFDAARITREAVTRFANRAVFELNRLHPIAHAAPWEGFGQLRTSLAPPFAKTRELLGASWQPVAGRPKWSLLDLYFRRSGVDGMTDPWFLEVLVNHDVLPFERAHVLAHEWAHLGGAAHEAEASFTGWLTCVRGAAPHQYSAWLFLYPELVARLPREERSNLFALLNAGPKQDFEAIRRRIDRINPLVQRAASNVYDQYLKANRVQEGIASYGRVVQLIAGTRFDEGWIPVRATRNP